MRRKVQPKPEVIIPPEILEQAKRSLSADKIKKAERCSVCGAETSPASAEPLCWVCRRLKVSAWRDTEARHIAERVVQLNPRDRNTVTNLIDTLRAYDEQPRSNRRRRKPSTSDSA